MRCAGEDAEECLDWMKVLRHVRGPLCLLRQEAVHGLYACPCLNRVQLTQDRADRGPRSGPGRAERSGVLPFQKSFVVGVPQVACYCCTASTAVPHTCACTSCTSEPHTQVHVHRVLQNLTGVPVSPLGL